MRIFNNSILAIPLIAAAIAVANPVYAVQFTFLAAGYTQEIYTGPLVGGPGMAWTNNNNLLTRDGSNILEYSPTQNATHLGTPIHSSIFTHSITGLASTGYGMANGNDGYIYTATGIGLQRFDPNNWAASAQTLAGTIGGQGYGITTLANGNIVYVAGSGTNEVYVYDPSASTNSLIFTAPTLIDDIEANLTGEIALAGQGNNSIFILNSLGTQLSAFSTANFPDGLAFGNGITSSSLYSNDNKGTITEYIFGSGYSSAPTTTNIIASGGSYGDLAAVGPDCALYVSQFNNNGYHGSAFFGTNWDNGTTNNEPSVIRIASSQAGVCAFEPPNPIPEPNIGFLMLAGLASLRLVLIKTRKADKAKRHTPNIYLTSKPNTTLKKSWGQVLQYRIRPNPTLNRSAVMLRFCFSAFRAAPG